jgi:radical SAM superfamily enzyme YgiQ (UPF0313 family)
MMKDHDILIYLSDLTHTQITVSNDSMPLNVGMVAAYVRDVYPNATIRLFKYPERLLEALKTEMPTIMGFSNYPWNHDLDRAFARYVKANSPDTVTVMGGPFISYNRQDQKNFLTKVKGEIDFYCMFEGETSFLSLLNTLTENNFSVHQVKSKSVPGVLFLDGNDDLSPYVEIPRSRDINEYPSPYTSGVMDEFFDDVLSPMLETHRGCPFSCTFCHEGHDFYRKISRYDTSRILEDLEYIATNVGSEVKNLIIADPNFGQFPSDIEYAKKLNDLSLEHDYPKTIFASTAKNSQKNLIQISRILTDAVMPIWMSAQSLDSNVLESIKRKNISVDSMLDVQEALRESPQGSLSELIMCLPGETLKTHIDSLIKLIELGMDKIQTYQLMLLDGSQMKLDETSMNNSGFVRKYRILPRSFSYFPELGYSAEIEEIVISTNSFSWEDYLEGRIWHLLTAAFYSGNPFKLYFEAVRELEIDMRYFVERILENVNKNPVLKKYFQDFTLETENELFDSFEEADEYLKDPGNFHRLLNGEIGANLLQSYTCKLFISCRLDMNDAMYRSLVEVGNDVLPEHFAEDLREFYTAKLDDFMSQEMPENPSIKTLHYDFERWVSERVGISDVFSPTGNQYTFYTSAEKFRLVESYLNRYGRSPQALGKALTRMWITDLYKEVEAVA